MFGNVALDVAISLIFIYLLYSLLASIVQELIARIFNLRARFLTKALRRLLEDDTRRNALGPLGRFTFFSWFYEAGWSLIYFFAPFRNSPFLKQFYDEPTIRYLGESNSSKRPSYISPQLFSQTMLHMLRGRNFDSRRQDEAATVRDNLENNLLLLGPETRNHLWNLFQDAKEDIEQFRYRLEQWFDELMARTSGWYRKQIQTLLIILGFIIAWQFNVDSIAITKILMKDKKAREQLVALATQRYQAYGELKDSLKRITVITQDTFHLRDTTIIRTDTVQQMALGNEMLDSLYRSLATDAAETQNILGISRGCKDTANDSLYARMQARMDTVAARVLSGPELQEYRQSVLAAAKRNPGCYSHPYQQNRWLIPVGWLITALAISLGAPFWFDLLNRIVKIRTGGPPPPPATESGKTKG